MKWSPIRLLVTAVLSILILFHLLSGRRNEIEEAYDQVEPENSNDDESASDDVLALKAFVDKPILSYDEAVKWNSLTCPTEGINFDEGTVKGNDKTWRKISSNSVFKWRQGIAKHLDSKLREESEKQDGKASSERNFEQRKRGIVMAAGNRADAVRARTNIRFLRSYNCTLPVEIFRFSNELTAVSDLRELEKEVESLSEMEVTLRTVEGVEKGYGWKAFQIKGAAIQQSSFDEILYLDTDSYLLRNPEELFEGRHFKETGLLLWPDYTKSHPANPLWRLLGQQCRNEYEGESGQLVISRSRHQDVLWIVEYFALNHGDFYGFMGGDRDSFRAAALLLDKKWSGPGRLNAAAGIQTKNSNEAGGHTMLQADPDGNWMFVHANLIKHGNFPRPLWAKIQRVEQDRFAADTTYGSMESPNEKLGEGVKVHVDQEPRLASLMSAFEGYEETVVTVEDWDTYDELKGFEDKWFGFGGVH